VFPLGIALVTDVFPRGKVASAQGIISGTIAIGMTLGLVIGAYVVQDLGWHYAFYITFVLSVGLFLVVAKVLRKDTPGPKTNMDYTGTVMLMAGITLVLIYLTEGPTIGWLSIENLAFLIPGLTLSILFFIFESKISSPLIQLSLLRIRNVLVANLLGVISGIVMFLAFFAIIYYAQLPAPFGLGMDIISTGLALAPATLIMMMVGPIVGRMLPKIGPKPIILIGSPVMIVGFLLFLLNRSTGLDLTIDAMVLFAGTIAVIIPMVNMISVSLPKDCMTTGMGFNTMLRNLGGAIGPVLATTLMTAFTAALIVNVGGKALNLGQFPSSSAFDLIFIFGIILSASIFGLGLMIKNYTFGKDST
jgi:MFS family permease